jgi:hypothetical protein
LAFIPIQCAADIAPNGNRHCIQSDIRAPNAPRSPRLAKVDSPDRAEAEDMAAQPTRDREHRRDDRSPGSRNVFASVDPGGTDAKRFFDGGDSAFAHAHADHPRVRRQAVDVVERETGVSDGLQARVDRERERIAHQPPADRRASDARRHRSVLEAILAQRRSRRRNRRLADRVGFRGTARLEERQPHVLV